MHWLGIGLPVKLKSRKRDFRVEVIWLDRQRAFQHRLFVSIAMENSVTERNLLKRFSVSGVEIACAFQVLHGLLPASLPPLDISHHPEYPRVIRQGLASNVQLSQRPTIIELAMIKISRMRQVRFTRICTKAKRALDCRLRQRAACRRMVEAKEIELVVSIGELTVRLEKGGIPCEGLVQQVDCLKQICFQTTAKTQREEILGPIVEVEGGEVGCWRLFNGQFLGS